MRPGTGVARPVAPVQGTGGKPRVVAPVSPQVSKSKAVGVPATAKPQAAAVAPGSRGARPVAPKAPVAPPAVMVQEQAFFVEAPVEGEAGDGWGAEAAADDVMIAPAPDPAKLGYVGPRVRKPKVSSLNLRRTMIPMLLTTGVLLCVFGALKFAVGPDSPYSGLPNSVVIGAGAGAAMLFAVALMNMMQVRAEVGRSAIGGA